MAVNFELPGWVMARIQ